MCSSDLWLYNEEEMQILENYIENNFGKIENVFHEIESEDIHLDIAIIPPSEHNNFYQLVTMGMGARPMTLPAALEHKEFGRAELVICLPTTWNFENFEDEKNYWPVRLIKTLARLPIMHDTWLGWGHTIPWGEPFAESTELCGALLIDAFTQSEDDESNILELNSEQNINFLQIIPLSEDAMNYKVKQST